MLTLREQRNFQFDFLRPQHSLFQYFTKLLEQYTNLEDQDHGGGWDATGEAEIATWEHFLQGGAFYDQKFAIFSFCFQDFAGCEHLGLLQHDAWYDAPASAEGAWREEEIGCVEQFWVLGTIVVTIPIVKFLCWEWMCGWGHFGLRSYR